MAENIVIVTPRPPSTAFKYNCYDYLQKAFYASGNYKKDEPLPFKMTAEVTARLENTVIYECESIGRGKIPLISILI